MTNEENPLYSKKVQDILYKLISEEMLANLTYHSAVLATTANLCETAKILEMFKNIADDELYDHHKALCQFAVGNGYQIPTSEKEYKKYASEDCWKLYDSMKKNKDAKYYVELLLKSEQDAVKSYNEVLTKSADEVPYELISIVQKNYYDEVGHLDDLKSLFYSIDACANLTWTNSYETTNLLDAYWW